MRRLLFVCALTALAAPAIAADWVKVGQSQDHFLYIDADTIAARDGLVESWEKRLYTKRQPNDVAYALVRYLNNCSERTRSIQAWTFYRENGSVTETVELKGGGGDWSHMPPGSVGESAINYVCKSQD